MNDRVLVEALRAGDPGALAAMYDTHAESIYRYCWSLLHDTDSAQVALRDTLIAAQAHAASLADPGLLRPWLYALARGECLRRRMAAPPGTAQVLDGAPAPVDPGDGDLRVMACDAVRSLPPADSEMLDLAARHGLSMPELARVLAIPPRDMEAVHDEARDRLRDAITAEILARKGPYDCPQRGRILTGFTGDLTPDMRAQLVAHLPRCETCSPHRTRQVSTAKVFELLPQVKLPDPLRVRVLSCFVDPELFLYRRYVARRSEALDAAGFPVPGDRMPRKWPRALAGTVAAVATVVAIALIFDYFGKEVGGLPRVATVAFPPAGDPPGVTLPWQSRQRQERGTFEPILDSTATRPFGATPTTTSTTTQVRLTTTGPQPPLFTPIGPVPSRSSHAADPTLRPGEPPYKPQVPVPTPCPTTTPPATPTASPAPPPTRPPTSPPPQSESPTAVPSQTPPTSPAATAS
ncbi:RNA polymerase sigma factor [Nonomuraea sp. LPB2021202275-12-8]|uniref:RNA polymerase sigma factor n=1 Tax=Nonomuraea sp. LPB2021202275-12-8 TaxID=3120159 RepID=UPI00300C7CA2